MDTKSSLKYLCILIFFFGCASPKPPAILNTLSNHQQVLIVEPIKQGSSYGVLSAWQNEGQWTMIHKGRAVLGRTGIAEAGAKQEGDGHTPSGIYSIPLAFGYAQQVQTGLPYRQATSKDFWVDDVHSPQYNQWVQGKPQAKSFEEMRRKDNLYSLGAVIEYNMNPVVAGQGSAIFLHIWRAYYKPTAGCVALSQRDVRRVLSWLDKDKNPAIVLLEHKL